MSIDWFERYVYGIVVNKKFISKDILDKYYDSTPESFPIWKLKSIQK
jgi:aminopeptidase C